MLPFLPMKHTIPAFMITLGGLPLVSLAGIQGPVSTVSLNTQFRPCRAEKIRLAATLDSVAADIEAAPTPAPIALLVAADGRLRAALGDRPSFDPCESDRRFMGISGAERWTRIGVRFGYWEDLEYSGQLLREAHERNPNSAFRPYTLAAGAIGGVPQSGWGMPDIAAASQYEREFPGGPFIKEILRVTADFQKDLYMVLRDRPSDYRRECYAPYITTEPWPLQRDRAQRRAVEYYRRFLAREAANEAVRILMEETERGVVVTWSFCAD